MTAAPDRFAHLVDKWKASRSLPWGGLLHNISRFNIARHLGNSPLRVLDVGGGTGVDSIHYAKRGHSVTLFDCSPAMLKEAKASAEGEGVIDRLTVVEGDADAFQSHFCEQQFDLIVCHLMIEMVSDSHGLLREMCKVLASGGLLSVLDVNRYSQTLLEAFIQKDLIAAIKAIGITEYYHQWVDRIVPRFSAAEIIEQLNLNGCSLAGQYGVSCITHWLPNEPKFEPGYLVELEKLERRLTDTYPYYLLARNYQVIARKD